MHYGRLNKHASSVRNTWLINGDDFVTTILDSLGHNEYGLEVAISKGRRDDYTTIPIWIDVKR
jgi:hypothetical protein